MAQTSIVMLRRCLPLRRSRDPQLIKGRWSVDGGIDYFKGDADVNVSVVAQNFLMVKMAGRSFGRKKTTVWLSPCPRSPSWRKRESQLSNAILTIWHAAKNPGSILRPQTPLATHLKQKLRWWCDSQSCAKIRAKKYMQWISIWPL